MLQYPKLAAVPTESLCLFPRRRKSALAMRYGLAEIQAELPFAGPRPRTFWRAF